MCDYCDCRSVPLIEALGEDHAELLSMAAALEATGPDLPAASVQLAALLDLLDEHTRLEELALFPALAEIGVTVGAVARLLADHDAIDQMGARVVAEPTPGGLAAVVGDLRAHIHREEHDVFPAAVRLISSARWDDVHRRAAALSAR